MTVKSSDDKSQKKQMKCWKCGKVLTENDRLPGPGLVYECEYPCEAENYGPDDLDDLLE